MRRLIEKSIVRVYIEGRVAWKVNKFIFEAFRGQLASFWGQQMKIFTLICHKLVLTRFWPRVVSWRFEITTDEIRKWYVSKLAATSGISDWLLRVIAQGNVWHGKMFHNFGMEFPQRYDPRLIWQLENSEKCLLPNSVWPTTHSKTSGMPFSLHWGSPKSLNSTYRTAGFKPSDPRHSHTSK